MSRRVLVTGGIGSGKSEVCRFLASMGYVWQYNADSQVKTLYERTDGLVGRMEEALGCNLRNENGTFSSSLLAAKIFTDREALRTVESIVFPLLAEDFVKFCRMADESSDEEATVIFESATALEKPFFDSFYDSCLFVCAPYQVRLYRATRRDSCSIEKIERRMANQSLVNRINDSLLSGKYPDQSVISAMRRISGVIVSDCSLDELEKNTEIEIKKIVTKKL